MSLGRAGSCRPPDVGARAQPAGLPAGSQRRPVALARGAAPRGQKLRDATQE